MAIERLVTTEVVEGVTVVSFGSGAATIQSTVVEEIAPLLLAAARSQPSSLLLDMEHVEFFNSTFIELLVKGWRSVRETPGAQFALCNLQPYCQDILDVTNLTQVWKIYPSRAEGIVALQPGK